MKTKINPPKIDTYAVAGKTLDAILEDIKKTGQTHLNDF